MDGLKEERERDYYRCAHKEFFTPKYYFTVIDVPGAPGLVKNMITEPATDAGSECSMTTA